jgi:hypothetical protein
LDLIENDQDHELEKFLRLQKKLEEKNEATKQITYGIKGKEYTTRNVSP